MYKQTRIIMKDLIVEGRALQDKFSTMLVEVDFGSDVEKVKETSNFDVVIPNSFDSLKKITGITSFKFFVLLLKKDQQNQMLIRLKI